MKDTFTIDPYLYKLNFRISMLEMQKGIYKSTKLASDLLDEALESKD